MSCCGTFFFLLHVVAHARKRGLHEAVTPNEASVYLDHVDCPCDDQLFATLELLDDENKPTYFKLSEAHRISLLIIRFLLRLLIFFFYLSSVTLSS